MSVVGANGRVFGDVDDIEIDAETWRMTNLIVRVSSAAVLDLGLDKPFWSRARLSVPVHQVSGATEVVVLKSSLGEFAQMIAAAVADTNTTS
jgi:sporulation protein YlmC with PRC-barrel domain